ncbi:MAG: carboxymuconolactone decarboxylase family protein [Saprospiraceae bacterium]
MKEPLVKPLAASADARLQEMADFYEETLGFTPTSLFTMMRRPRIANAFLALNQAVMDNQGRVTSALKRLIAYLASRTAGCRYCEAHAIRAAERYGATDEQLENIWEYKTHPAFSEAERAALDLAVAASLVPNAVDETIAANMRAHWDEGEIVEIMGVIALFGYLNRWNDSMATRIEEPAVDSARQYIGKHGWETGKHR